MHAACLDDEIAVRRRKRAAAGNYHMMPPRTTTTSTSTSPSSSYQVVNLQQWKEGWSSAHDDNEGTREILPLVDLRSRPDFEKCHLSPMCGATVVNLPLSTLLSGERSCELPPRCVDFAIIVPREHAKAFEEGEVCDIHRLFFASQSKSTLQSRKPWLVRQVLVDDEKLWKDASEVGLVQQSNSASSDILSSFRSLPKLWKPDPLVSSAILPALKEWIARNPDDESTGVVLDLGSGAGRDVCYLAEEVKEFQQQQQSQCKRSIHFVGIDNHKGSAKRCTPLWKNRGVADIADSCLLDLNKLHLAREYFEDTTKLLQAKAAIRPDILCIFAIRFLNWRLISYIANSCTDAPTEAAAQAPVSDLHQTTKAAMHSPPPSLMLPLGTLFAVSHFCKPEENACWEFEHPKESSVLERWELRNLFTSADCNNGDSLPKWHIMKDDIVSDGDHGRTLIQFLAKKVA